LKIIVKSIAIDAVIAVLNSATHNRRNMLARSNWRKMRPARTGQRENCGRKMSQPAWHRKQKNRRKCAGLLRYCRTAERSEFGAYAAADHISTVVVVTTDELSGHERRPAAFQHKHCIQIILIEQAVFRIRLQCKHTVGRFDALELERDWRIIRTGFTHRTDFQRRHKYTPVHADGIGTFHTG